MGLAGARMTAENQTEIHQKKKKGAEMTECPLFPTH